MFIEADPFRKKDEEFFPGDILPPGEDDLQEIRSKVTTCLSGHRDTVETVSALYSGSFNDLSFSVQSSTSFSEVAAPSETLRATAQIDSTGDNLNIESNLSRGHKVSLSGEVIDDDSTSALVAHAIFAFIRGDIEAKSHPEKMAKPQFRDALTSLYFNAKNIIGSKYLQEAGYSGLSTSSDEFFRRVPGAITAAIQKTERGEFVTSYRRDMSFRSGEVSVTREESFKHVEGGQKVLPSSCSVEYVTEKQIWDPLASIDSKEHHSLYFTTIEEVPRYLFKIVPFGDVKFKPGFDAPPFSNGLEKAQSLKDKYKVAEEREAYRGDFRRFKSLLDLL